MPRQPRPAERGDGTTPSGPHLVHLRRAQQVAGLQEGEDVHQLVGAKLWRHPARRALAPAGSLPPPLDKPAHMRNLCRLLPLRARLSPACSGPGTLDIRILLILTLFSLPLPLQSAFILAGSWLQSPPCVCNSALYLLPTMPAHTRLVFSSNRLFGRTE